MNNKYAGKGLAAALVGAPLLWLGATALAPRLESKPADQLTQIAAHPDRWYGYTVLLALGTMLLVPAIAGIVRLTRDRSTRLTYIGATLLGFGTLIAIGDVMSQLVFWQMASPKADRAQMAAVIDRFDNAGGAQVLFGPGGLSFLVGSLLLAIAMFRTRSVPRWAAVVFFAGFAVQFVGFSASSVLIIAASAVLSLVSMAAIARAVVTDEPSARPVTGRPAIGAHTVPS